jgi:hypothetical protein
MGYCVDCGNWADDGDLCEDCLAERLEQEEQTQRYRRKKGVS